MSGKREQRRGGVRHSKAPPVIALIIVIAALVIVGVWVWAGGGSDKAAQENGDRQTAETGGATENALPEIEGSSGLTLSSVYTSSIQNPDCEGEYAEEVASLEVTNHSGSYLVSAALTATMSDGTEALFEVYDLPAGATAEIFDTENQTTASGATCTALVCTSEEYIDEDVLMSNTISVAVSGSGAVITNTGESELSGLTVVYHCDMAGLYFGGTSYAVTIDNLEAGGSCEFTDDALAGEMAVVRVYQ